MLKLAIILALGLVYALRSFKAPIQIDETYSWTNVTYQWPSEAVKNAAIKSGDYIPENVLVLGLDRWKNKLFVTTPRWKAGIPATLSYIDLDTETSKTASLIPYPSWDANTLPRSTGSPPEDYVISTFRPKVDSCDRLWIVDSGVSDILGASTAVTGISIAIFNLTTDTLIRRYTFPTTDYTSNSFFANIVVDVTSATCDQAFAYVPDVQGYGLVVYDFANNASWRISHNYFHFDPVRGDFTIAGVNFQWTDGIFGLALGRQFTNGDRRLYFHALASDNEFSVSTTVLKNKTLATDAAASYHLYKIEGDKGLNTQTSASAYDETTNVLFFPLLMKDGLACWNTANPLHPDNVGLIAQDHDRLVFIQDIKIDEERNIWFLSDKFPQYSHNIMDNNVVNFRIFKIPVDTIISDTVCQYQ